MASSLTTLFPLLGAAIGVAGSDKLAGNRRYRLLFHHLGWSKRAMQLEGAGEIAGGLLMVNRSTRRLGGALVAISSAAVLASEVNRGDQGQALARGLILLAATAALLWPDGRPG